MRRHIKSILILLLIIFIFYLIGRGHIFWGIFLLFVLFAYIYNNELKKINKEFNWIATSLMDENELKGCREHKVLYHFALDCFYAGKIKKGMGIEEFAKVLLAEAKEKSVKLIGMKSSFLRERAEGLIKYDRDKENYSLIYFDYGSPMPTPALQFKFKKGSLVKIGLINHGVQ